MNIVSIVRKVMSTVPIMCFPKVSVGLSITLLVGAIPSSLNALVSKNLLPYFPKKGNTLIGPFQGNFLLTTGLTGQVGTLCTAMSNKNKVINLVVNSSPVGIVIMAAASQRIIHHVVTQSNDEGYSDESTKNHRNMKEDSDESTKDHRKMKENSEDEIDILIYYFERNKVPMKLFGILKNGKPMTSQYQLNQIGRSKVDSNSNEMDTNICDIFNDLLVILKSGTEHRIGSDEKIQTIRNYAKKYGLLDENEGKKNVCYIRDEREFGLDGLSKISDDVLNKVDLEYSKISESWGFASGLVYTTNLDTDYIREKNGFYAITPNKKMFKFEEVLGRNVVIEYVDGKIDTVWMGAAQVGENYRLGANDIIFRKLERKTVSNSEYYYDDLVIYPDTIIDSRDFGKYFDKHLSIDWNKYKSSDFMYYDYSAGRFLSNNEWKNDIHIAERLSLSVRNAETERVLPQTVQEAIDNEFYLVPEEGTVYHGGERGNLKFIHKDGREVILVFTDINKEAVEKFMEDLGHGYELYYDIDKYPGEIRVINGRKRIDKTYTTRSNPDLFRFEVGYLDEHEEIGNTYNYAYNEMLGRDYIAHFYFDMLTFYWWGCF